MRRVDQHRLACLRARKLGPIPTGDPSGFFVREPEGQGEAFITFAEVEETCQLIMDPANASLVENQLGKMDWKDDPTYNLRRTK